MKTNKKVLLILLFLTGLAATAFFQPKNLELAPDVIFTTLSGKKINLKSLQGQPVLVTFWATDCASCIKEIPSFIELYEQFHPEGLEIIAVTMYYDIPSHVVAMTRAKQLPYDVALDLKAEHAKAFKGVQLTPTTFLISPSGYIVTQKTGFFDLPNMKQKIKTLLTG